MKQDKHKVNNLNNIMVKLLKNKYKENSQKQLVRDYIICWEQETIKHRFFIINNESQNKHL